MSEETRREVWEERHGTGETEGRGGEGREEEGGEGRGGEGRGGVGRGGEGEGRKDEKDERVERREGGGRQERGEGVGVRIGE